VTRTITCGCPSECPCWDENPRQILGCQCSGGQHVPPTGCRYEDTVDGWRPSWPGVTGRVMVCLTHGGRAPGEAYEDTSTTAACIDGHLHGRPRRTRKAKPPAVAARTATTPPVRVEHDDAGRPIYIADLGPLRVTVHESLVHPGWNVELDGDCPSGLTVHVNDVELHDLREANVAEPSGRHVTVGQVWADNDHRSAGRRVLVVGVDDTHATVELLGQRGRAARGHDAAQVAEPGRRTRIRLDRFWPTSTGYRLVSEGS